MQFLLRLFLCLFGADLRTPRRTNFRYWYQVHPFDDRRYFTVAAYTQTEADILAQAYITELFEQRKTVMTEFYRAA